MTTVACGAPHKPVETGRIDMQANS